MRPYRSILFPQPDLRWPMWPALARTLSGNTFTIEQVTSGCSVEPIFETSVTPGDTLRIALEEPVKGDTYSGVGNLRGWAVATVGVDRVEIWIDGAYAFDAPYGGARADVGNICRHR